jgi:hypothetical protein
MEKRITIGIPPAKKDSRRRLVQRSRQRSASHRFEWFAVKPLDQAAFRGDAKAHRACAFLHISEMLAADGRAAGDS